MLMTNALAENAHIMNALTKRPADALMGAFLVALLGTFVVVLLGAVSVNAASGARPRKGASAHPSAEAVAGEN